MSLISFSLVRKCLLSLCSYWFLLLSQCIVKQICLLGMLWLAWLASSLYSAWNKMLVSKKHMLQNHALNSLDNMGAYIFILFHSGDCNKSVEIYSVVC